MYFGVSSVFRCFKCISVYFGVYTDRMRPGVKLLDEARSWQSWSRCGFIQPQIQANRAESITFFKLSIIGLIKQLLIIGLIIIMAGMAVFFNVAGYLIEERCRWPVITASPRGQCSTK